MNTNSIKKYILPALITGVALLSSCKDSWLEPKPLSFYTPENAYTDAAGLYSAITSCERNMRHEFFGDAAPILTEMYVTDLAVEGTTDKAGPAMNLDVAFLPSEELNHNDRTKVGWYWYEGYKGIKYANVVIARIDDAQYRNEAERNAVLGAAYFQRAYRYFKLTHQFGDIPYLDWEITTPKYDFYSYDRWSILERMKEELEFAYEWVPKGVDRGRTSNAACGVLLMKVCMALCDFDRAITIGKEIVSEYPLMTEIFANSNSKNLMLDLHSVEAKMDMRNTEGLMYVVSYPETEGSDIIQSARNGVPYWAAGYIRTPTGHTGNVIYVSDDLVGSEFDSNTLYGRGIGRLRPTNYLQYTIWTEKEKNDMRGRYNSDSWKRPEDLIYNNPALLTVDDGAAKEWYGAHMVKPANMSVSDSIRGWFSWPHFKLFVPDPLNSDKKGGETPWYIYRSAEVWLMLAECYYWKDQLSLAAEAINQVRARAKADPLTATEINIGAILDERARELYYEENRHVELVRISYTYAKTGKSCEVFGRTYKLENFSGPGGTGSNVKQEGINFYYDWVNTKNNFYNKGIVTAYAEYKLSVHHVLWPIPEKAINSNVLGQINQNIGYPGAENNIQPLVVPKEGTVLGP